MNKKKLKEQIELYFMDELNPQDREELEKLIMASAVAKLEFEKKSKFYNKIASSKPKKMNEESISELRKDLVTVLRYTQNKSTIFERINNFISPWEISLPKFTLSASFSLVAGLIIGFFIFYNSGDLDYLKLSKSNIDIDQLNKSGYSISNIQVSNYEDATGNVRISFDAVKPVDFLGSPNDEVIKTFLARAIVSSDNPGVRIKSLSAIANESKRNFIPDPTIKNALISALKADKNPAVRLEALNLLKMYPIDGEIKDALLFTLANDDNSGLRVASINAFAEFELHHNLVDKQVIHELTKSLEAESNQFVKIRAASLLKGVN